MRKTITVLARQLNHQENSTIPITVTSRTVLLDTGQCKNLPLTLLSELLAAILSNADDEILIEGSSQNFVYDIETGIQAGKMLTATVSDVRTQQKENTIEISLDSTIETAEGFRQTCNLYFYMWWHPMLTSPLRQHCIQQLKPQTLTINLSTLSKQLSDAVFELDLSRRKKHQQPEALGQGRGYLVFGRPN